MAEPWIGFDLDGTLAVYDEWRGPEHIGEPVEAVVALARRYIETGMTVKVLTARVCNGDEQGCRAAVEAWTEEHIGTRLEVTNEKDYGMIVAYDDRVVHVEQNTGRILSSSLRRFTRAEIIERVLGVDGDFDSMEELLDAAFPDGE